MSKYLKFALIEKCFRLLSYFVGANVIIFCILEVCAYLLFACYSGAEQTEDPRAKADAYYSADWTKEYFRELNQIHTRWEPYLYWRRMSFRGKYINVSTEGYRETLSPKIVSPDTKPLKVYVFGGSTVWGTGARDTSTIPSLLQQEFDKFNLPCSVKNFGESGYVSTQDLFALVRSIQSGDIPDLAVFYEGINDIYSAFQNLQVGLPQNEFNRVSEFNLLNTTRESDLEKLGFKAFFSDFNILKAFSPLRNMIQEHEDESSRLLDINTVSSRIVEIYIATLQIGLALSKQYGFDIQHFWQPVVFEKSHRTAYEESMANKENLSRDLFIKTYELIRQRKRSIEPHHFADLSTMFSNSSEPTFIDAWHVGEKGNAQVASAMMPYLIKKLLNRQQKQQTHN